MINLICDNCKIREICIVYGKITELSKFVDIDINNCKFKSVTSNSRQVEPKKRAELIESITKLSNQKTLEEKKKNTPQPKPELKFLKSEPLELTHVCEGCGGKTFAEDIGVCQGNDCNNVICSCCATLDGDTKKILCPTCWQKA